MKKKKRTETVLHLEPCRGCKGKGTLGRIGKRTITCEECWGSKLTWVERCALVESEE